MAGAVILSQDKPRAQDVFQWIMALRPLSKLTIPGSSHDVFTSFIAIYAQEYDLPLYPAPMAWLVWSRVEA